MLEKNNILYGMVAALFFTSAATLVSVGEVPLKSRDGIGDYGTVDSSPLRTTEVIVAAAEGGEFSKSGEMAFIEATHQVSKQPPLVNGLESEVTGGYLSEFLGDFADVTDFSASAMKQGLVSEFLGEFIEADPEQILVSGSEDELEAIGVYISVEDGVVR